MLALLLWEDTSFERSLDQICKMVKVRLTGMRALDWDSSFMPHYFMQAAVADKDEAVRGAGRRCYWVLHHKFPVQAQGAIDGLPPKFQKHLASEEKHAISSVQRLVPKTIYRVSTASAKKSTIGICSL